MRLQAGARSGWFLVISAGVVSIAAAQSPWVADLGNGQYRNPIIHADYSDPDVIRVGGDYYLTASSFNAVPGLPILHSRDLVNWSIAGHAAPRLPSPRYDQPQHGNGIWAPSLRFHAGRYWIYVGDPDLGIFMTSASDPRGPWEPLALVMPGPGRIDPCPLWDEDGRAYLVHAWAKSRAGFNSVLTVVELTADGRHARDGTESRVFDGTAKHPTIEGPKFYKRNGLYYIFAPAGGVKEGWQTVLRASSVRGPYEDRVVLSRGSTSVNGPHQGGWVETAAGESWFVHFQDRGAYGRVTWLEPMVWRDGWPVIGADPDGDGTGEPVMMFRKPVNLSAPPTAPEVGDEFDASTLSRAWQWQANPSASWWSLSARPGFLRLNAEPRPAAEPNLWNAPNILTQKLPADAFTMTMSVDLSSAPAGTAVSLVAFGLDYGLLRLARTAGGWSVQMVRCLGADQRGAEQVVAQAPAAAHVQLRMTVESDASARFSFSRDEKSFADLGDRFPLREGKWVGAKLGLVATGGGGYVDVDWIRFSQ